MLIKNIFGNAQESVLHSVFYKMSCRWSIQEKRQVDKNTSIIMIEKTKKTKLKGL